MSEDGDDIEFLDEDAEIVQQCVQTSQTIENAIPHYSIETELLVERLPHDTKSNRKKKRVQEDDFDYDPNEDIRRSRGKQRKTQHIPYELKKMVPQNSSQLSKVKKESAQIKTVHNTIVDIKQRRKMDIIIPDYEDPLCLPVRAAIRDIGEANKLRAWNNLCLEKFKHSNQPMRVDKEETVASKRTIEVRNVRNSSGIIDTTINSKIVVQNKTGAKKIESLRSVLPRYREKKILNNFRLYKSYRKHPLHHKYKFILQQESSENEEGLVIYEPDECMSYVYKMYDKECNAKDQDEDKKFYLKETECQKMCSPCYHATYKGYDKVDSNTYCHICKRIFLNSKILVSHLRSHSQTEVNMYKKVLSKELSMRVTHSYKCRICQRKFMGITALKKHVTVHTGLHTPFECEAGSHLVR